MPKTKAPKCRTVPYVRGFHAPSEAKRNAAVIAPGEPAYDLPREYRADMPHFPQLPKCTSIDDWLAQYKEDGQTYRQFLSECPWLSRRKPKYIKMDFKPEGVNLPEKYPQGPIYIVPLEHTSGNSCNKAPDVDAIVEYTEIFLGFPVRKMSPVSLEAEGGSIVWSEERDLGKKGVKSVQSHMKSRYDRKTGNYQLCISNLLLKLRKKIPEDAICLVALTMFDLYEDPSDLFVAGMAAGNHRVAVFSLLRYDPNLSFSKEFWYDIRTIAGCSSQAKRRRLILQRSCKLVVHEIGHLLGIDHCIFYSCCMNGSGHLQEDYSQPMSFCPVDLRKLQALCGVDVRDRYKRLQDFYQKTGLAAERDWVQSRIQNLSSDGVWTNSDS